MSAALAFLLITFLHVVVGELMPKSIALQNPERTSLVVAGPTLLTERMFKPAIWALNGTGNFLLRLVGVQPASGHELVHSVEELKMLVDASTQGGVVQETESEMLHAVFDFGEMVVRQVMVPRTEVLAVEADDLAGRDHPPGDRFHLHQIPGLRGKPGSDHRHRACQRPAQSHASRRTARAARPAT